jgi:hypothetical protein
MPVDTSFRTCTQNTGVYVGCFTEPECGPQRPFNWITADENMTVELCADLARERGYRYSAVQWYEQCWGGNDITPYTTQGQASAGTCSTPCKGNPSQVCGGPCANAIYDLQPLI